MKSENPCILLVEDEEMLRSFLTECFTEEGYKVISASGGLEGADLFFKSEVDVIISDVRMPVGSGVEFLKTIRAGKKAVPPFIFVTGFADLSDAEAISLGGCKVLHKPFRFEELLAEIAQLLKAA